MGILEKLHLRGKETGVSGLQAKENTFTFIAIVIIPWYVMQIVIQFYVPQEYWLFVWPTGIAIWLSGIIAYNQLKQTAAAKCKWFPAALCRFPDGTFTNIDLAIPPITETEQSIELIGEFGNEPKYAYLAPLKQTVQYYDSVFSRIIIVTPKLWDNSFFFRPGGEAWHDGVPVEPPSGEGVALHFLAREDWHDHMGETVPVCVVADCDYFYRERLKQMKNIPPQLRQDVKNVPSDVRAAVGENVPLTPLEVLEIKNSILRKANIELNTQVGNLEDHLDAVLNASSQLVRKQVKKELEAVIVRDREIMSTNVPLRYRLINMKSLAIVGLVLAFVALIYFWSRGGI